MIDNLTGEQFHTLIKDMPMDADSPFPLPCKDSLYGDFDMEAGEFKNGIGAWITKLHKFLGTWPK